MANVATTAAKPAPRAATPQVTARRPVEKRPVEKRPVEQSPVEARIVKAPVRRVVNVTDGEIRAAAGGGIASYGRCADGTPVTGIRCGISGAGAATYVSRGNSGVRQAPTQRVPRTTLVEARPGSVSPRATIVPRHVYHPPEPASARISVPDGYRPAWTDDRLNERRAYQTLNGKAEMELIWTRTVPRRLVDRVSGEDVTSEYPRLFYPFTDYETQRTYLAAEDEYRVLVGQRTGTVRLEEKAAPVISSRSVPAAQAPKPAEAQAARKAPVARSAPVAPRAQATGAAQYVQVGAFGVAANAQGSLRRLRGAGLPAVARPMRSGGKVLQVVMAGPFTSSAAAQAALGKARAAGFGDAFLR
ncbi:hypothetical protein E0K89_018440 [Aquicoccus sp. SCR17]|nr:hypothetical protein [Carideicomes alvinocaridis]